ncbi:MAG: ABC transporter substrate-binding protein [Veillonella sp.]|uniref:ABC transporter substrate-binding protein n=1 Tax=Veillonella caviae TaxID=248316 RepID=UPI000F8F4F5E|nr:ABC transporter substrate-binding protein [Veillonella caviae]MCF0156909.1 ABC transporter substrate-binding protein [Veillonella sp.]
MYRISKWAQILVGTIVSIGILWLGYTHGTGVTVESLRNLDRSDAVIIQNYDGEGHSIDVAYQVPPQRVLVTYPGATELLIALGLDNRIIGTLKPYGVEPVELASAYSALPTLQAPFVPSKEEVLALQPDLIIGWNHHFLPNALGDVRNWYKRGVGTYIVPATVRQGKPTVESTVYPFIDDMGRIFGVSDRTDAYKQSLMNRIADAELRATRRGTSPTVLILQTYGNSTYTVYGDRYIIHDIVHKAGAITLASKGMMTVGPERILGYDPDYIVLVMTNDVANMDAFTQKGIQSIAEDPNLQHMRAVAQRRIIPVLFSAVNNGNGRVVDALEMIVNRLETDN